MGDLRGLEDDKSVRHHEAVHYIERLQLAIEIGVGLHFANSLDQLLRVIIPKGNEEDTHVLLTLLLISEDLV